MGFQCPYGTELFDVKNFKFALKTVKIQSPNGAYNCFFSKIICEHSQNLNKN